MRQPPWDRVKSLLANAAALPAAERERFVIEHCPDPALQRELLELLASPAPLTGIVAAVALEPGARLGPYVIDHLIGKGGMGEVYKAQDTTLNRSVAIKVLPDSLVDDPERQVRLRREAQLLAALNHPNIAQVHGFEASTGIAALVMELVDGPTLADRVGRALPLAEALSIAGQIADALGAAHERGIIHRDLKPANIKVRENGTVKVLDFGLAKVADSSSALNPNATASPTLESPVMKTGAGTILGTAAYMAPEQALGRTVDKRADIWAFGCVLYEMLTGRRAFRGTEISDTLASVIRDDPDWTALPPNTPAPVVRVLRRCLEKTLNRRLADIADARLDIEEASSQADGLVAVPVPGPIAGWRRLLPWAVAALSVAAVAVIVMFGSRWQATPVTRPMHLTVDLGLTGEGTLPGSPATLAVSPDGNSVAFVPVSRSNGIAQLYLRSFDRADAVQLPGTNGANGPFFSPDGQWIAFFASGKLKKIAVTGGEPITLCDAPIGRGGSWSEDGTIVFSPEQQTALWRVSSDGGKPEAITTLEAGERTQRWPQVLPDGKAVLYSSVSPSGNEFNVNEGNLVVQTLPAGPRKVILRGAFYGRYAPSGHLLYLHNGTLLAAPFDRNRLELTGPSVPVTDSLISNSNAGTAMFAVSTSGALVYVRRFLDRPPTPITWLDRSGQATMLRSAPSAWNYFAFAPDGRRLAFSTSDGRQSDIWVDDLGRDAAERVTRYNSSSGSPVWTPDGRRITFSSMLGEKEVAKMPNLYWQQADGPGTPQRLTTSPNQQTPGSWLRDGKTLAFTEERPRAALMLLPMGGDEHSGWQPGTPTVFLSGDFDVRDPAFSPDGHWIAYQSNHSGQYNVYVRPFPGPGVQIPISTEGGQTPKWSPKRSELIYATLDQRVMIVNYSANGDSFHADQPRPWPEAKINPGGPQGFNSHPDFDLHPDGDRLVLPAGAEARPAPKWDKLNLVLNFFDELRRIAPTGTR